MGSEIMGPLGWVRLDPVETAALVAEITCHFDCVAGDCYKRNPSARDKCIPVDRVSNEVAVVKKGYLASNAMPDNLINLGYEEGVDTSYRAELRGSHPPRTGASNWFAWRR
jgi:hypothetical protein